MAVGNIPKFTLTEEDLKDFNFEQYLLKKYKECENYGVFILKPPPGYLSQYDQDTLKLALPKGKKWQWKSQKRKQLEPNIYKYHSVNLGQTDTEKLLNRWESDPMKNHFRGKNPHELKEEFVELLSDKKFKPPLYSDNNIGTLFLCK